MRKHNNVLLCFAVTNQRIGDKMNALVFVFAYMQRLTHAATAYMTHFEQDSN